MKLLKLGDANEKTAKTGKVIGGRVLVFDIPALRVSVDDLTLSDKARLWAEAHMSKHGGYYTVCGGAGRCAKGCFALSKAGAYQRFKGKRAQMRHNLELVIETLAHDGYSGLRDLIVASVRALNGPRRKVKVRAVRIHSSGDFFHRDYALAWKEAAWLLEHDGVACYAYTKAHADTRLARWMRDRMEEQAYVASYGLPLQGLRLTFSEGSRNDDAINREHSHSRVFGSVADLEAAGYEDCSGSEHRVIEGAVKVGLVFHIAGAQKAAREAWGV